MFELDEPLDVDQPLSDEAQADAIHDAVLVEYAAAHADLKRIRDDGSMDRRVRWAIFERFAAARSAMEAEMDRVHYGAINTRVVGEILRGAA